jgi:hypothetical protein
MSRLENVLEEARKLPLEERRQLAARLLEEGGISSTARQDEKLEAMRAANDELFLDDLTATMEEWEAALDDFADSPAFSKAVSLVDDSRESIYREREDSQL